MNLFQKNKLTRSDVIITHCYNRIGYNVLRSLGKKGLKVVIGVDQFSGMGAFSRHRFKTFYHPSYWQNEKTFIKCLRQSLLEYTPSVYIPTDDIFVVGKYIDQFKDLPVSIPISSLNTLNKLHNKYSSAVLAKSLGIPIPETLRPKDESEILNFLKEYGEPVVLKILNSSSARGVFYLYKNNLSILLNEILKDKKIDYGDFIVQQYEKGTGYGVSMLFNHGKLRAKFTHKRLREMVFTGGASTLRVSIKNRVMEEYAELLLREVVFHGVAMVEFKYNEKTGNIRFMEVNPRFWGSVALAIQSGVDFPYLLYKMAVEGDVTPCINYKTDVTVKWLLGDIVALIDIIKSSHSIRNNMKYISKKTNGYDDFSWDDPFPLIAEFFLQLHKSVRLKFSKVDKDYI